jgi:hypothetical protein
MLASKHAAHFVIFASWGRGVLKNFYKHFRARCGYVFDNNIAQTDPNFHTVVF